MKISGLPLCAVLLQFLVYTCLSKSFPLASPPSDDITPPTDDISPPNDDDLPTDPSISFELGEEWKKWKLEHKLTYSHEGEEYLRREVWLSNMKYIKEHNSKQTDKYGYKLAMNQFGDMTYNEWKETYLSDFRQHNFTNNHIVKRLSTKSTDPYPDQLDWRSKNAVTPVKNQGKCGACYAFSAIGALEGVSSLAQDKLVTLSEQNIIDCSVPFGNHGCHGGSVSGAFLYMISTGGVDKADSYPYISKQSTCRYEKDNAGSTVTGIIRIPSGNEKELLAAVATVGPVSVSIDASSNAFRFYSSGIFNTIHCSTTNLNHAMVVTGYGLTGDKRKYWLVKNSWGTNWGEKGYVLMAKGNYNQCGIATDASYPTL